MKNYLFIKKSMFKLKEYILIFLATSIFLFISLNKSLSEENIFTINNIKVKGTIGVNFKRENYFNEAFNASFKTLMQKILLTRDLIKIKNTKTREIKKMISSFQIIEEKYRESIYYSTIKINYNERKIKEFLGKKNISFSLPRNISAVFFPILFVNGDIKNFNENFFYKNWPSIKLENELINFILPIEDLEDVSNIRKMKDNIENIDINSLVNKYDENNYVFTLMSFEKSKLKVYLKTNFNNNKTSKNIFYEIKNIEDKEKLNDILIDIKTKITDLWREQNLINLLMPLSINLKFEHKKLKDLEKIRNAFSKISIIDNYTLQEFNINNSFFKLYYFGNPIKLKSELLQFGYNLKNNQGAWQLYLNE